MIFQQKRNLKYFLLNSKFFLSISFLFFTHLSSIGWTTDEEIRIFPPKRIIVELLDNMKKTVNDFDIQTKQAWLNNNTCKVLVKGLIGQEETSNFKLLDQTPFNNQPLVAQTIDYGIHGITNPEWSMIKRHILAVANHTWDMYASILPLNNVGQIELNILEGNKFNTGYFFTPGIYGTPDLNKNRSISFYGAYNMNDFEYDVISHEVGHYFLDCLNPNLVGILRLIIFNSS